jgi:hypothetical protein
MPIPSGHYWSGVVKNRRAEDMDTMLCMPYFGDNDQKGVDVNAWDVLPDMLEPQVRGEAEEMLILVMMKRYEQWGDRVKQEVEITLMNVLGLPLPEIRIAHAKILGGHYYLATVM